MNSMSCGLFSDDVFASFTRLSLKPVGAFDFDSPLFEQAAKAATKRRAKSWDFKNGLRVNC
jgi:hypothetical protein